MSQTTKYFIVMASMFACLVLLAAGCAKKRIYTDPNPPGSTPQQSRDAASSVSSASTIPAGARPATARSADSAAEPVQPVAANSDATRPEQVQPAGLGTALPVEADLLSGTAGVLDDELLGFPLANGSSYDPGALVAGHRTLPLGSKVEVTDTATGRSVLVTIADRGPFDPARVVDLSRRAASDLGMGETAEVSLKVVGADMSPAKATAPAAATPVAPAAATPAAATQQKTTPPGGSFYVQVGAFEDQANAKSIQNALTLRGVSGARLVGEASGGGLVRVQAGPYASRAAAEEALRDLRADYPASFIIIPD